MNDHLEIFFSNRLEILYSFLKANLFDSIATEGAPKRQLIVVYGPAMKNWLLLRMAQDPDLEIAMGMEFIYLNRAFEHLLQIVNPGSYRYPSMPESALAIEAELKKILHTFKSLNEEEQKDWLPFIRYLKLDPDSFSRKIIVNRKSARRLTGLSQELAALFRDYGRYGYRMTEKWEHSSSGHWQSRLWNLLFDQKSDRTYFAKRVHSLRSSVKKLPFTLHFFSISFMTRCEFDFLQRLAENNSVYYYMLSPCAVFWSDIRSDRERRYLRFLWEKKLGKDSSRVIELDEFLRDCNPLLANFGRSGREMTALIEESQALTTAHYVLPDHVKRLHRDSLFADDVYSEPDSSPLSLLHALQSDLLLMRNPKGEKPFDFDSEKGSIQLHAASDIRRETEILYHYLTGLMCEDPSLTPSDVIVMAPQIGEYVPYIRAIFGASDSRIDYQILDLGMDAHKECARGFLQLLDLGEGRRDSASVLQLFEHPLFRLKHRISSEDFATIRDWIERTGILWGDNGLHRNEILFRRHCEKGMVDETNLGTWDEGLDRLLKGLTSLYRRTFSLGEPVSSLSVEFSRAELLGKWIRILHSLQEDLSPFRDDSEMTPEDWADYFSCLLESYFQPDFEDRSSTDEYENLKSQFSLLRSAGSICKGSLFSFSSIKHHLLSLLQHPGMTYREEHLQSVRFCSLMPLRSIPARVIALIGLQEGAFPRTTVASSLDCMTGNPDAEYIPLSTDYDRYLFLEALHSARDFFYVGYRAYHPGDSKELSPSPVVEELFSYADRFYTLRGKRISENMIFKHPFDSFDERYFVEHPPFLNFSESDYRAASVARRKEKSLPHSFIDHFPGEIEMDRSGLASIGRVDVKDLNFVARNPIKFYLQKGLGIYLQDRENCRIKTDEPLIFSPLDKYRLKESALNRSEEEVLPIDEYDGVLPFGLFKTVAVDRLKDEVDSIRQNLRKHRIDPHDIFGIEFCPSCTIPVQIESRKWLFPPHVLRYEDGAEIAVTGKISRASSEGLISLSKGTLAEAWKMWPQFLLYCHAARCKPDLLKPELILIEAAKPVRAFFDDPDPYMKEFIRYYSECLHRFSPLMPEWISLIFNEDVEGLKKKTDGLFSDFRSDDQNRELRRILNKNLLPCSETTIREWKPKAEALIGDLIRYRYSSKSSLSPEEVDEKV